MSAAAIGAGANVVGGILQMIAARQAQRAIYHAIENEMNRQAGYRNQAFGTLGDAIPQRGVETARTQMAEGAQNRRQAYEGVNQASLGIGGQGQSKRDRANYSLKGDARAKLGSYSDWQLRQMVNHIRTQDKLNKISNFAGGTAQVFPYVLNDAQHKGDTLAGIGQLISSIGGTATSFGSLYGGAPTNAGMGGPQFGSMTYGPGGQIYQSTSTEDGGFSRPL